MARSQNGWIALQRDLIGSYSIPGGKVTMRKGDVSVVLGFVARFVHTVEPLLWPGCWGYAERNVRLGSSISNHGSGTALDLSAPRHPLGVRNTWSASEKRRINTMLAELDAAGGEQVIRWGENYRSRVDGMHFEVVGSERSVARAAEAIREGRIRIPGTEGASVAPSDYVVGAEPGSRTLLLTTPDQMGGDDVKGLQVWVGAEQDGWFDPATEDKLRAVQAKVGAQADGVAGPETWKHYAAWVTWTAQRAAAAKAAAAAKTAAADEAAAAGRPPLPKVGRFTESRGLSRARNAARHHGGVEKAQRNLALLGLYRPKSDEPGRFGDDTEAAVKALQRARGLTQDGVLGPATWPELERWS